MDPASAYSHKTEPIYLVIIERGADIRGKVKSIKCKLSPLVQSGLEIPIKVTVQWEDERPMDILRMKTEEVSYPLGETDPNTKTSRKTF